MIGLFGLFGKLASFSANGSSQQSSTLVVEAHDRFISPQPEVLHVRMHQCRHCHPADAAVEGCEVGCLGAF